MHSRREITEAKRVVVKIGSALLTNDGQGLDAEAIASWVDQMAAVIHSGIELVLVSSGAVAEGALRLGWQQRPKTVHELQAAAAVGQMGLVQCYQGNFARHDLKAAQILLVHDDLTNRQRYLNARRTLQTLMQWRVVPVVNENDTVVTDEIRFGDNDTLAALVANLVDADLLLILTDQVGLYERDPRQDPGAPFVARAQATDPRLEPMASGGAGALGRGGMLTKVRAGRLAARSGTQTIIASGREPDVLRRLLHGDELGTWLVAEQKPMAARKQWLAGHMRCQGVVELDDGAVKVLRGSGRSLLSVGVRRVEGDFERGAMVSCVDRNGEAIARGLINYGAEDARKIAGHGTDKIFELLGYRDDDELIHRDNLVLV